MNRNLVVCKDFDEFSTNVEKMDLDVEDIVGLITSICNVIYWINIESIWGILGFTWKNIDDYGIFNYTTIPFSIIPKVPDGERIKSFKNTFNNISSNYIEIQKSNWTNLYSLNNPWQNHFVKADLTGATITYVNNLCYFTSRTTEYPENSHGVYIKADLSNVDTLHGRTGTACDGTNNSYKYGNGIQFICLDDDNKGLNAPTCNDCWLYWNGAGPFKLNYFFRDEAINSLTSWVVIYSENQQYEITNIANSKIKIIGNKYSNWDDLDKNHSIYPTEDMTKIQLTIDGSVNPKIQLYMYYNTRLWHSSGSYNGYWFDNINLTNYNSIDVINPYYLLEDEWPTLPDQLNKWEDSSNSAFYPYLMVKNPTTLTKCKDAYTLNIKGRRWLSIFREWCSNLTSDDFSDCTTTLTRKSDQKEYKVIDILPTVNWSESDLVRLLLPTPTLSGIWYCLPNTTFKVKNFNCSGYYIQENTIIKTGFCETFPSYTSVIWDSYNKTHWKIVPLTHQDRYELGWEKSDVNTDKLSISVGSMKEYYGVNVINNTESELNCTEIDDSCKKDEVWHNAYINTWNLIELSNYITSFKHDLVVCGDLTCSIYPSLIHNSKITIDSSYIYLYCNLSITVKNEENSTMDYSEMKKFISSLQKLEEGTEYTVTLKKWIFDKLTDNEKQEILNKGYTLIEEI